MPVLKFCECLCEGWFEKSLVGLGKVRGIGAKRSGPESVVAPNISPQHQREKGLNSFPFALSSSQPLLCSFFLSLDPSAIMITGLAPFLSSIFRKLLFLSSLCIRCLFSMSFLFQFYMLLFSSISAAFSNSERCAARNLGFVPER